MKIEMGEQLMYSWLRQVEGCQIAQLNWKASVTSSKPQPLAFFETLREKYNISSKLDQFLKQTEIDLLGIKVTGNNHYLFAVDIAFHEGGLNYSNVISKITKKMISSALALNTQFGVTKGKIIFASPKVADALSIDLYKMAQELKLEFQNAQFDYEFELIFNSDFKSRILNPVIQKSKSVKDMSDLFIRSIKMLGMFNVTMGSTSFDMAVDLLDDPEGEEDSIEDVDRPKLSSEDISVMSFKEIANQYKDGNLKIGKLAPLFFEKLAQMELLHKLVDETPDLTLRGFKLLKEIGPADNITDLKKEGSYNRYYANILSEGNRKFLLCSQWYDSDFRIILGIIDNFHLK